MRRRGGTGSIDPVTRADGTVEFYPRLPNRKRLDPWPSRELAEVALAEALHQIAEGRLIHTDGLTLATWGRRCIEQRSEDGFENADKDLDRWAAHVESQPLGAMDVTEIQAADVVAWVRERLKAPARRGNGHKTLRKRTLGRSNVVDALRLVRMAFKEATAADPPIRADNPAKDVAIPRARRTHDPWTWLTPAETRILIDFDLVVAEREGADGELAPEREEALLEDRDATLFALHTGVREGENWTLHLKDCYPDTGRVWIRYGGRKKKAGKWVLKATKSGKPRLLQLSKPALEILLRQMARLERKTPIAASGHRGTYMPTELTRCATCHRSQRKHEAGDPIACGSFEPPYTNRGRPNPLGLLWPSTARQHPGAYRQEGHPPPCFKRWVVGAGLTADKRGQLVEVTFHTMRHTWATLTLVGMLPGDEHSPWPLERVSAHLGHTDIQVTQRYADAAAFLLPNQAAVHDSALPKTGPMAMLGTSEEGVQVAETPAAIPGRVELPTNGLGNTCFKNGSGGIDANLTADRDTPFGKLSVEQLDGLVAVFATAVAERRRVG